MSSRSLLPVLASVVLLACEKAPPEIVSKDPQTKGAPTGGGAGVAEKVDPVTGPVDLKTATAGLPAEGKLTAEIETDKGTLSCTLFEDKAPKAVANFVALARGIQPFKDPATGKWTKRPAYDGSSFHRIIKGFMFQGGDPTGTGTGDPGYVFPDELWGGKHDRAGLLCMANKGPNTNGMQFFVTDAAAPWLDNSYTIFGECGPEKLVHEIASVPVAGETPISKPRIAKVTITRK